MKAKKTSTTKAIDSPRRNVAEPFVGKIDDVKTFSFEEIKYITRNFENEIGRGGFGLVYEGQLRNGLEVAVKVLSETSSQGKKEFINEAKPFLQRNQLEKIMDSRMSKDLNLSSVWKVVDIGLTCVDINKNMRPTMREVKKELDLAIAMEIEDHSSYFGQSELCGDYGYDLVPAR
ncbi:hypothetical protein KP509_09G079500 [Ceratopteris richardii]|uniref:Serine-threonine/tyrosine-protein kinase catalytic domain-containing protein n=1 Tax=Ceratopteris richardii TaxID=49495 RepID=A0A8T2U671_CERRI|nr:hypothetical protein KP509_09G079500 [Ceratopteris richardii]